MLVTAVAATAAAAVPASGRGQPAQRPLLDVPYLAQTEALCGGAAIAMVMRYWGARAVYAETFASLVDPSAGGIRGRELMAALQSRGFAAESFAGDAGRVEAELANQRPPIALVEDRPGRFHYVVIVGWNAEHVTVHDPARAPFRVIPVEAFQRAWSVSGFWTLVATPRSGAEPPSPAAEPPPPPAGAAGPCGGLVEEGIRLAGAGDLTAAGRVLEEAATGCPTSAAPLRELAGLQALRADWAAAARYARDALRRDGSDAHAARILATSLFLEGQPDAALDAWNRNGAPLVDLLEIAGLERTRFAVAASAIDLPPETLLTRDRLSRARRRVAALPAVASARVLYEPDQDDRAKVRAVVLDRPLVPSGLLPLIAAAAAAAADRELSVDVASPTGSGERWRGSWRWWHRRPRVALGFAAPAPFGGVWAVDAFSERQTYGAGGGEVVERRRSALLSASDWITGVTRLEAGLGIDGWSGESSGLVRGAVLRELADGLAQAWAESTLVVGDSRGAALDIGAQWRSTEERTGSVLHTRGGFSAAAASLPFAFWPGAGTGQGRAPLLRAHPLLRDGRIAGVFGSRLAHGGIEWRRWRGPLARAIRIAPAVFVDAARAFKAPAFGDQRTHVDVGVGVRLAIPTAGVVRVDVARGLRDGEMALSIGLTR
jgi:hypothetical protein